MAKCIFKYHITNLLLFSLCHAIARYMIALLLKARYCKPKGWRSFFCVESHERNKRVLLFAYSGHMVALKISYSYNIPQKYNTGNNPVDLNRSRLTVLHSY